MTSNIKKTWNDAAEAWTDFVREGKDIARNEMNLQPVLYLLGNIKGKMILDLCCGEGINSRIVAGMGAQVTGIDISERLIEFADEKEKKDRQGIEYHVIDASNMDRFENESFDLVVCFMALMDIEDYRKSISEVSRVLNASGRFIFSITHPCFEQRIKDGKITGGWEFESVGHESDTDNALHYKVDDYFETDIPETVPWTMPRLKKPFETIAFHRTLSEYSKALHDSNLLISRIIEPKPTEVGIKQLPVMKGFLRIPHSIVVEAVKR